MCVSLDDAPHKGPDPEPVQSWSVQTMPAGWIHISECPRCYALVRTEYLAMHNVDGHS